MSDSEIYRLVNQISNLLNGQVDSQGAAVALGYYIGLQVATTTGDLERAMQWLGDVADDAVRAYATGELAVIRTPTVSVKHTQYN